MCAARVDLSAALSALQNQNLSLAEMECRSALRSSPTSAAALCVLASLHSDRGDDVEALRLYRSAMFCSPTYRGSYQPLAQCLYLLGRFDEAAEAFRDWARIEPNNAEARHMGAAAGNCAAPERCSEEYVKAHFDRFSGSFDAVLIQQLGYRGPKVVAGALGKHRPPERSLDILDAGCGTGLCGPAIRDFCRSLVGIDLSEKMIERARTRGCYDELLVSDLCEFMVSRPASFDAIVSCDVLIYFGALEQVVKRMHDALRLDGLLILSIEALSGEGNDPYRLQVSGRYAHRESYFLKTIRDSQLKILSIEQQCLRLELGERITFHVLVAQKLCSSQINAPVDR